MKNQIKLGSQYYECNSCMESSCIACKTNEDFLRTESVNYKFPEVN